MALIIMLELLKKRINEIDAEFTYRIYGKGKINLVIEIGLGATAGEWHHIAEKLSEKYTVLLYERNQDIKTERTPQNIAKELYELLGTLDSDDKIIILAHSQGGLYAQQFARLYPEKIKGLLLIDPLSANDNSYKTVLNPQEQKQSGFDKTANLVLMNKLAKLHLGFVIKAFMKNAPPFYYYRDFSKDAADYILTAITKSPLYTSALEEYRCAHDEKNLVSLKEKNGFPDIPLVLITHSSEFSVNEIVEFGHTSRDFADKVENLWQSLMKEYLTFSNRAEYIQAKSSGHFIHLTEPELIDEGLLLIEKA